jgi:hypothetical protein
VAALGFVALTPSQSSSESGATSPTMGTKSLYVHRGTRGLRIVNDEDNQRWTNCIAEIEGGYSIRVGDLGPRGVQEVYYENFQAGGARLREDDGYGRALRSLEITCAGSDGRYQTVRWSPR